jgi:hypothetical protein
VLGTPKALDVGEDGSFKFEGLSLKKYQVRAGKNLYSQFMADVELTKQAPDATVDVFIFPQTTEPGLYVQGDTTNKIENGWVGFEVNCSPTQVAWRTTTKRPDGKVDSIPPFEVRPTTGSYMIYQASSVSEPVIAKVATIKKVNAASVKGCEEKLKGTESVYLADLTGAQETVSIYKSNAMYELTPTLNTGLQVLYTFQAGKPLKGFLFNVK